MSRIKEEEETERQADKASNKWKETAFLANDLPSGHVVVASRKNPGVS